MDQENGAKFISRPKDLARIFVGYGLTIIVSYLIIGIIPYEISTFKQYLIVAFISRGFLALGY